MAITHFDQLRLFREMTGRMKIESYCRKCLREDFSLGEMVQRSETERKSAGHSMDWLDDRHAVSFGLIKDSKRDVYEG